MNRRSFLKNVAGVFAAAVLVKAIPEAKPAEPSYSSLPRGLAYKVSNDSRTFKGIKRDSEFTVLMSPMQHKAYTKLGYDFTNK